MSDTVAYIINIALVVLPAYLLATQGQAMILALFELHSLIVGMPFP